MAYRGAGVASADGSLATNEIAAVATDGSKQVVTLVSGDDFYAAPRVSPDGRRLAWLSWNLPDMPWDSTQLWVGTLELTGEVPQVKGVCQLAGQSKSETVHQPAPAEWLFQPEWHQNKLYFVSENGVEQQSVSGSSVSGSSVSGVIASAGTTSGSPASDLPASGSPSSGLPASGSPQQTWSALWSCEFSENGVGLAAPRCLLQQHGSEIQIPQWVFGESRFAVAATGLVWATSAPDGDKLCFGAGVSFTDCSSISNVQAWKDGVVALAAYWDRSPEIIYLKRSGSRVTAEVIRQASGPKFDPGFFPAPESLSFGEAHALYFAPAHPFVRAPSGTKPPLIVLAHGGPTAAARRELSWNRRYWTSRGFAVIDVNYRGSTGFGRQYRNAERSLGDS